jgi:nicotinate phosphoribosyltransferase
MIDLANRAYNHSFPRDWIVRSLLDTDFYKLLMHQFIWRNYPNTHVSFSVTNRTKTVRLAEEIDLDELRAQLDHVRTLRFQHNELIWLAGNTFYGQEGIFGTGYLDYLRASFKLSDYDLTTNHDNGQINLTFSGPWVETTLWELYGLTIINELRYRQKMKSMKASQLDIMYARAKVKLYAKLERLNTLPDLNLTDFGTRRRHSFLWQEHAAMTACEVLGAKMTGTSNALLAMKHGLEAKGTNAHELPMVLAALAKTDEQVKAAQYRVLQQWQEDYRGNLLVFLPDTFGTTQFLKHAPQWVDYWVGARPDSKNAFLGGEELIDWWTNRSQKPSEKLVLFSDGLDVRIDGFEPQGEDIVGIYEHFNGRVRVGFGWGTMLTNDFIGCHPLDPMAMKPISLVCKVSSAEDRPAVKLSDNYEKATGPADEVERYRRIFGHEGMANAPVIV